MQETLPPFRRLEKEWAGFNGVPESGMVACSSGTAALHLALESLRLPPRSLVAVPDYTMVSCARAVTLAGHLPVFVGCGSDLTMDLDALDEALSRFPVRAAMAVHVYGRTVPMDELAALADKHGVAVIEDSAEAHGVHPHPRSDAVCWSFYRNKIVAGEEGGAVFFSSESRADLARQLRCVGFTDAHDYDHVPRGHNYRLANVLAFLILESLSRCSENVRRRREIESWCDDECPEIWRMPERDAPWVYDVRLRGADKELQDSVVSALKAEGIAARHGFRPMGSQREYRGSPRVGRLAVPPPEIVYLSLDPSVSRDDVSRAFAILRRLVPAP